MNPRLRCLILAAVVFAPDATGTLARRTVAGTEVVTIAVPTDWRSKIVFAADRDCFAAQPEGVLVNGGYFDASGRPDALLVHDGATSGRLRNESPYSGFVWADPSGKVHIARRANPPSDATWAIQAGPLLIEDGRSRIKGDSALAPRSVIALRGGQVFVIRTAKIALRALADDLVRAGMDSAINLDGGPSSSLRARIGGVSTDRPGTAEVPYFIGFAPRE